MVDERSLPPRVRDEDDDRVNPLERLQLLSGDDAALEAFLDDIDVKSPRAREMMLELARRTTIARPERFFADHQRAVAALESLRRHGFRGSRAAPRLGPVTAFVRWGIELVARYIVVSYVQTVTTDMRNLYLMREIESPDGSHEMKLLRSARFDAAALVEAVKTRAVGVPTFVIGGLLLPLIASMYRLATGLTFDDWVTATIVGVGGVLVGVAISWFLLRGTALASGRIRLSVREPLRELWKSVGNCGNPPRDHSRRFAIVGITLTIGVWIVVPTLVGLSFLR
ncbi:MAG TPA: hypothetical protein VFR32_11245 [Gaiellaceae bacterium]|nr:hypothetical protein [Gaiellaceae bacterium]